MQGSTPGPGGAGRASEGVLRGCWPWPEAGRSVADGLEAGIGLLAAELGLHLAEFLGLGLAPPDGPGDGRDADQADQVETDVTAVMQDRGDGQQRDHVHDL